MSQQEIILIGPSTRAMAGSALRAGLVPHCIDLFGDVDLRVMAAVEVLPVEQYPQGLVERAARYPASWPVMYTGGLENHPEVYLTLAEQRPMWGYLHPDPLHGPSVRRPEFLDDIARQCGFRRPRHQRSCRDSGPWLVKPRAGAGGRGIRLWHGQPVAASHFLEEVLQGICLSAACVHVQGEVKLLGITRQLVSEAWLHAPSSYSYCGNVGPWLVSAELQEQVRAMGQVLAASDPFLLGLFGMDLLLTEQGLVLLEVNPRYTASLEVLEQATGEAFVVDHVAAFQSQTYSVLKSQPSGRIHGKAIYYAALPGVFPAEVPWQECADIPAAGTILEPGQPVLTLLAEGNSETDVIQKLQARACEMDMMLNP